jgi:hypothetical protein
MIVEPTGSALLIQELTICHDTGLLPTTSHPHNLFHGDAS